MARSSPKLLNQITADPNVTTSLHCELQPSGTDRRFFYVSVSSGASPYRMGVVRVQADGTLSSNVAGSSAFSITALQGLDIKALPYYSGSPSSWPGCDGVLFVGQSGATLNVYTAIIDVTTDTLQHLYTGTVTTSGGPYKTAALMTGETVGSPTAPATPGLPGSANSSNSALVLLDGPFSDAAYVLRLDNNGALTGSDNWYNLAVYSGSTNAPGRLYSASGSPSNGTAFHLECDVVQPGQAQVVDPTWVVRYRVYQWNTDPFGTFREGWYVIAWDTSGSAQWTIFQQAISPAINANSPGTQHVLLPYRGVYTNDIGTPTYNLAVKGRLMLAGLDNVDDASQAQPLSHQWYQYDPSTFSFTQDNTQVDSTVSVSTHFDAAPWRPDMSDWAMFDGNMRSVLFNDANPAPFSSPISSNPDPSAGPFVLHPHLPGGSYYTATDYTLIVADPGLFYTLSGMASGVWAIGRLALS